VTATIPRVKLARTYAELPAYQIGHWVIAGTPGWLPYPCTCWYDNCDYPRCPDRGRTEGDALPPGCCGRASRSHGETPEPAGGHSNTQRGRSSTRKATEGPRHGGAAGWERSVGPQRRAAVVSQPLGGPPVVAGDLWAAPWDIEPPAWMLDEPDHEPDSHDEVSPLAGKTREPTPGHSNGDAASRQHSEPSDGLYPHSERRRSKVERCDCKTPWDPPPPVLLVAETKDGPVRVAIALDGPQTDIRAAAEKILAARGYGLKGGWKDGRHVLLPPEGKLKTRPGFLAEVFNVAPGLRESALAVIDTPPERPGGVHCPDCHRDWQSAGAYEMHRRRGDGIERPRWAEHCVDPATIRVVPRSPGSAGGPASISRRSSPGQYDGASLLKRGPGGVWHLDPLAPWGPGGPPFSPAKAMEIYERGRRELKRWQFGKGHNRER
jgi:hypothetical protein